MGGVGRVHRPPPAALFGRYNALASTSGQLTAKCDREGAKAAESTVGNGVGKATDSRFRRPARKSVPRLKSLARHVRVQTVSDWLRFRRTAHERSRSQDDFKVSGGPGGVNAHGFQRLRQT